MNLSPEVIIVGGGFSGLAAAKKLHEHQIPFLLLEARGRLGGRTFTKKFEDFYLDFGGQWIGPTQDRMYALCHEYGVRYYGTYNQGKNILDLRKKIKTYRGVIPKISLLALLNLDWIIRKLERLARSIDIQNPWNHPKAKLWDKITLEQFLRENTRFEDTYAIIRVGCDTIFASDPDQLSLLHALFYIRSGTSLDCLINVENGAQQDRIVGGMQHLAEKIAADFTDSIRFNSPVRAIQKRENGYEVSGEGFSFSGQQVIIAIPPPLLNEIEFRPVLPSSKKAMLENYPMGSVAKCFMIYDKPFWRDMGFSGQSVSDQNTPYQAMYDCSPADASKGIMMGFSVGSRMNALFKNSKDERQNIMKETLSRYFGSKAENFQTYEDFTMSDEIWSRGCYAALMPTGAWTTFRDEYRTSVDQIHFAGTEAATRWHGYIEGAVLAGESAASKVLSSISSKS